MMTEGGKTRQEEDTLQIVLYSCLPTLIPCFPFRRYGLKTKFLRWIKVKYLTADFPIRTWLYSDYNQSGTEIQQRVG